ncbi:MAG: ABC1 kinase family protein [Vicinamibacteria bacterium]
MRSLRRAFGIGLIAAGQLARAGVHRLLGRRSPGLARAFAGPPLTGPQRLRTFFERSGGAFIKLGQLLALQPDILPLRYCNELYDLLDRVDPCPYADIESVFREELGRTPDQAFDSFDHEALSTASIGQVHVATRAGRKYAVKVRRRGADAEFAADIRLMDGLLRLVESLRAERFYWIRSPITEFIDWTSEELDYRQEARYMEEIRRNSERDLRSIVPAVDWTLTTRRTLVVEFLEGTTVLDLLRSFDAGDERLLRDLKAQGFDPPAAARSIIDIFLRDAFMHGIFHADLHPANLLILPGNVIGYVDFGITGSLSGTTRRRLATLTIAWSVGDLGQIAETFFLLAKAPSEAQKEAYREGLAALAADWYQPVDGQERLTKSFTLVMLEMLALSHRTGIMPDRAVTRYLRSAMATDGLVKRFAPGLDVAAELELGCRRYLTKLLLSDFFSFENVASWSALMEALVRQTLPGRHESALPLARKARPRADASRHAARALRLAVVGFAFAAIGALTKGELGPAPGLLAASLGVSLAASLLLLASLVRQR